MIYDHFQFTFNQPVSLTHMDFFGYPLVKPADPTTGAPASPSPSWATIFRQCALPNQAKYNYTKLAIVVEDDTIREAAG